MPNRAKCAEMVAQSLPRSCKHRAHFFGKQFSECVFAGQGQIDAQARGKHHFRHSCQQAAITNIVIGQNLTGGIPLLDQAKEGFEVFGAVPSRQSHHRVGYRFVPVPSHPNGIGLATGQSAPTHCPQPV
jgi:hypothetical protein